MATTPSNPEIPGWGVDKTISGYEKCIVTDWESSTETQSAYCYDNKGAVCHRQDYDTKQTITATLLAPAGTSLPAVSDNITAGGVQFAVLSCRLIESNRDFQKISLTLEAYANWPASKS